MKLAKWRRWVVAGVLGSAAWFSAGAQAQMLKEGDKAPAFSAPSSTGKPLALTDFPGKSVVLFFYTAAFTNTWTQEALAFQLDLPKFEAANAQVLGVSVDFNGANQAWAEKLGLTYPLLADLRREISRAYGVLNDNPKLLEDAKRIPAYLRSKRSWFVIDKEGVIRYAKADDPRGLIPNDEILEVVNKYR